MERLPEALLVEEDPLVRQLLADALRVAGVARVRTFARGDEAMEHFVRARPQAAFVGEAGSAEERAALCAQMLALDGHALVVGMSLEKDDATTDDAFTRAVLRAGAFAVMPRDPAAVESVVEQLAREAALASPPL
jgi:DNA-binding NtrC family response regulator